MKIISRVMLVMSLVAVGAMAVSVHAKSADPVGQAIAGMENDWAAAELTGDSAKVASMLAESFVNTDVEGKVSDRKATLAGIKPGTITASKLNDVKVNVYGNSAVATGGWEGTMTAGGKATNIRERWTDTWVKEADGKWRCVASHQSLIK